jgi:hypothetical protein
VGEGGLDAGERLIETVAAGHVDDRDRIVPRADLDEARSDASGGSRDRKLLASAALFLSRRRGGTDRHSFGARRATGRSDVR